MKIIITEGQLFSLKSLNGVKKYVEDYLSQFEHFVKLEVRVTESSINYWDTVENPTLIYFEIFIDGPISQTNVEDEIQFAMDMYFPRAEGELISVMWDFYFDYL
jgi:hypothetical protein